MPAPKVGDPTPEDEAKVDPLAPDPPDEAIEGVDDLPDDVKDGDTFAGDEDPESERQSGDAA